MNATERDNLRHIIETAYHELPIVPMCPEKVLEMLQQLDDQETEIEKLHKKPAGSGAGLG